MESVESVLSRPFVARPLAECAIRWYLATPEGPIDAEEFGPDSLFSKGEAMAIYRERQKLGTAEIGEKIEKLPNRHPWVILRAHGAR